MVPSDNKRKLPENNQNIDRTTLREIKKIKIGLL